MIWPFAGIQRRAQARRALRSEDMTRLELRAKFAESAVAMASMSSGWSWRGGWSGDKFSGALTYPSLWSNNHWELRRRARIAYWDSVQARQLVGRLDDTVVNDGLILEATPAWDILDPQKARSDETRQSWTRDVETRFHLWARSKEADATARLTLYQLQGLVFHTRMVDGEIFAIFRYSPDPTRMSPLNIQLVDADMIQSPRKIPEGVRIEDGIELDASGREIAYHVLEVKTGNTKRIPKFGPKSRRIFMLHIGTPGMPGEVRAITPLASIIHELQKITDYTVAEIESAIINATIAAWIEPSEAADASDPFAGITQRGTSSDKTAAGDSRNTPPSDGFITKPGLMIQTLKAGEKLQSYDTKRPNAQFETFVGAIKKGLAASWGIPLGVLDMAFANNYSASRGELLLFWNRVRVHRAELASDFNDPVYATWLGEEVRVTRILAPGFNVPIIHAAWLNADWIGISPPAMDPLKEANAAAKRIKEGLTTRTAEARAWNGSEFSENAERLKGENEALRDANAGDVEESGPFGGVDSTTTDEREEEDE